LNMTQVRISGRYNVSFLVLWDPSYSGGAGLGHGSIEDLAANNKSPRSDQKERRGRLLVLVRDDAASTLRGTWEVLDEEPLQVELKAGLVANEIASVQSSLYKAANRVLRKLEPLLRDDRFANHSSTSDNDEGIAIHFVGRSLGGGVAALAATMLDGTLPIPPESSRKRKRGKRKAKKSSMRQDNGDDDNDSSSNADKKSNRRDSEQEEVGPVPLEGLGRGRCSAMLLGPPPCLSANVKAAFVKSIVFGDDVICRTTKESIDRLCNRVERGLKGGIFGRQLGWMSDTFSLTVSSLQSHARGSEGEEARLSIPGQAFLIRPRRLGGICSMHELGSVKGGREALRAAVLWQLHDVLLSKSLWKHHQLESYIDALDRVQLRGSE